MPPKSIPKSEDSSVTLNPLEPDALRGAVATKIAEVIGRLPRLGKEGENTFARYKYVSIDQYYESFAKIAAEAGLTWVTREVDFKIETVMASAEKRGREEAPQQKSMAVTTYEFDVYLSGAGSIPGFSRVTVVHGITGPQTSGSSASYAEKVFCRVVLKAVTGEPDGDAEEPVQMNPVQQGGFDLGPQKAPERREPQREAPRQEPREERAESGDSDPIAEAVARAKPNIDRLSKVGYPVFKTEARDFSIVAEIFEVFAPTLEYDDLQRFWRDNLEVLNAMKEDGPESYAKASEAVRSRANALRPKE